MSTTTPHHDDTLVSPTIHLGAPAQVGGLTLFPVWTDQPQPRRPIRTTTPRKAVITEIGDGPSVAQLHLANPTDTTFVVLEGLLITGGWQHRVATHDVLVAAHSELVLDVRCVEHGRWRGAQSHGSDGRRAPLAVRGALRGVRTDRDAAPRGASAHARADQSDVWARVSTYEAAYGSSPTSSLIDVIDTVERARPVDHEIPRPLPGQRGVLVGVDGHPAALEIFDHPHTLERQWDSLVRGWLADAARSRDVATPGYRARTFAHRAGNRVLQPSHEAGAGVLAETADDLVDIRALASADGRLLHCSVLNVRHAAVAS